MNIGRIGVVMGGTSAERDVSLRTGQAVARALEDAGCDVARIELGPGIDTVKAIEQAKPEVVFLALHGRLGEDGCIQGLLEVLGIPYTGSSVLSSALCMDKLKSKELFRLHNVPTPPYYVFDGSHLAEVEGAERPKSEAMKRESLSEAQAKSEAMRRGGGTEPRSRGRTEPRSRVAEVHGSFGFPVVVKPRREGSSFGITKATNISELAKAIELAQSFDRSVLVERFISGKEISVGILNGRVLGAIEIAPKSGMYDYHSKYTAGATEYFMPARLAPTRYRGVLNLAERAAEAHDCGGAVRVDLLVTEGQNEYVLEVNTLPGMTPTSLLPKIAAEAGYGFGELCLAIVESALQSVRAPESTRTETETETEKPDLALAV